MLEKITLLLQLQEIDITLAETKIVHGDDRDSETLVKKAHAIRQKIDPGTLSRYDRLIKQGSGIVQIKDGKCTGCNLTIAVGDVNRMISQKVDPICPHCGKFLVMSQIWDDLIKTAKENFDNL